MIELNIKEIFVNISGIDYLLVLLCALYGTAMKIKLFLLNLFANNLVPNCLFAFLVLNCSFLLSWYQNVLCQIVWVPNCPFSYLGAKLSVCLPGAKLFVFTILVPMEDIIQISIYIFHVFHVIWIFPQQIIQTENNFPNFPDIWYDPILKCYAFIWTL